MDLTSDVLRTPRALLIFAAVVRTGSCTAAAREFNITQPSVSRNIAQLEATLATPLFLRKPNGLEPTEEGLTLYGAIAESLQRIDAAVLAITQQKHRRQAVVLSLSTAFVTHWFVPRMREFQQAFPDVDLRFELTSGVLRGPPGNVDLAMRRTEAKPADDYICPFLPEIVVPVCSRSYLERNGALAAPGLAGDHILLELTESEIGWRSLLGTHADQTIRAGNWVEFSDYAVVLQTAVAGQGVALGWLSAISRTLLDGTLILASPMRLETGRQFSLIAPRGRAPREIVRRIRAWMVAEMQQDHQALQALLAATAPRRALSMVARRRGTGEAARL